MDIAILVIIAIFALIGLKKGFVKSILGLVIFVAAIFIATQFSGQAKEMIFTYVPEEAIDGISNSIQNTVEEKVPEAATVPAEGYTEENITAMLKAVGIPEIIGSKLAPAMLEFFGNYEGVTASKALAMYLTDAIKNLIAGLLVFIVAYVVLLIIGKIIEKIFHFPGLNIINRLLGLVLGAVKAVAIIWAALYAVSLIGPVNDKVTELAASAPATTWLIENNPVAGIIAGTFDPNAFVESLKELPEVVEKAAS